MGSFFFCLRSRGTFSFLTLVFLQLSCEIKGFLIFLWFKEQVAGKREASAPFKQPVRHLLVATSRLIGQRLKQHVTLYMVGWHMSASIAWKSSDDNFSPSPSFISTPPQKVCWPCKIVLNLLIISNLIYLFFNFIF